MDAHGRVTGIVTVLRDVTELKRNQRELRVTRERLGRAEQVAHLGCWEWNIPSDTVWWSLELYRIAGRDPDTFEPSFDAFIELIVSEDRHRVREQLDALWGGLTSAAAEFRFERSDGTERLVRGIATLRRDEDGEPLVLFGTTQDITAEREERAAFERERADLEELLRERTGALDRALDRLRRSRRR
jgi:PAS domain-containing protein